MLVLDAENIYSDSLQASQQLFLLYTVPFLLDYTNPLNFSSSSGSLILPVPLKFISPHFLKQDLKTVTGNNIPQNILSALLRIPSTTHTDIKHGIFSKHFRASRHTRLPFNQEEYWGKRHHSLFNSSSTQRTASSGDKERAAQALKWRARLATCPSRWHTTFHLNFRHLCHSWQYQWLLGTLPYSWKRVQMLEEWLLSCGSLQIY